MKLIFLLMVLVFSAGSWGQSAEQIKNEIEDETNLGGDIFSDFNEDVETAQVMEDERFYRYSRFFSVNLGGGITTFTGNRGRAYQDNPPTFHLSVNFFLDFHKVIFVGVEYSKHTMILDTITRSFPTDPGVGAVVTDMTRLFVGYKYYVDTSDLGTAITYSNPHFIGRMEYWYQTNKFMDHPEFQPQKGGGIGSGLGMGLEFPIELRKSYVSVQGLYHVINFFDKYTQDYRQSPDPKSTFGYDNLAGNVLTLIITYNFTW